MRIRVSNSEALMSAIRDDLALRDLKMIANRVGVHVSTLYAIRSGRTKWPRHTTMLILIDTLGFELWLIKEDNH